MFLPKIKNRCLGKTPVCKTNTPIFFMQNRKNEGYDEYSTSVLSVNRRSAFAKSESKYITYTPDRTPLPTLFLYRKSPDGSFHSVNGLRFALIRIPSGLF